MKPLPRISAYALALALLSVQDCIAQAPVTGRIRATGPASLDLGTFVNSESKTATFTVKNDGNGELHILDVRKSCGCADATIDRRILKPDQTATITLSTHPYALNGLFNKSLYVSSDDAKTPLLRMSVSGQAIPVLSITPNYLNIGTFDPAVAVARTFHIEGRGPDIELGTPIVDSEHAIVAELDLVSATAERSTWKLVAAAPPPLEPGPFRCTVEVPVRAPSNHPPLKVSIRGHAGDEIRVAPGSLVFFAGEKEASRFALLRRAGVSDAGMDSSKLVLPNMTDVTFSVSDTRDGVRLGMQFSAEFLDALGPLGRGKLEVRYPGAAPATIEYRVAPPSQNRPAPGR